MRMTHRHPGIYTPEDLQMMRQQLDKETPQGETPDDREYRALAILLHGLARDSEALKNKKVESGTDL